MKTTFLNPNRQQGMTYMTVIITMIVVGTMLAAYISLVSVQNNLAARSQSWNRSVPIVEAGIEEAMAHLNKNGNPDGSGVVNVANLGNGADGWWSYYGNPNGPWYKWNMVDNDYYMVVIDSWDGTTTAFPQIMAASYIQSQSAFTGHADHFYRMTNASINRGNDFAFLAAINPNIFPAFEANAPWSRRLVSCGLTNNPIFTRALVAKHGIDMNGQNIYTDSYDSRIGGRNINGRWDKSIRRDHGDIASNDTVTNAINVKNANIWGRVATGPMGTINIGSGGKVGDANYQATGTAGTIQPGYSTDDMNVEFPDVIMPTNSWSTFPGGGMVNGVNYDTVFSVSGNYIKPVGSGNVSGKVIITAPNVSIRVDTGWAMTGQETLVLGSNVNAKVYLNCVSADFGGNGIVNSNGTPEQLYIFGTDKLTSLTVSGNGEATSVIYAPYANVVLNGGGNSEYDFSGSIIANSFKFNGHFSVHYDEALGRVGTWKGFTIISWNER